MAGKAQDKKDFDVLSDCILSFVITCFVVKKKIEKMAEKEKNLIFGESDDEGASIYF